MPYQKNPGEVGIIELQTCIVIFYCIFCIVFRTLYFLYCISNVVFFVLCFIFCIFILYFVRCIFFIVFRTLYFLYCVSSFVFFVVFFVGFCMLLTDTLKKINKNKTENYLTKPQQQNTKNAQQNSQ